MAPVPDDDAATARVGPSGLPHAAGPAAGASSASTGMTQHRAAAACPLLRRAAFVSFCINFSSCRAVVGSTLSRSRHTATVSTVGCALSSDRSRSSRPRAKQFGHSRLPQPIFVRTPPVWLKTLEP
jgi:hypothetical protein